MGKILLLTDKAVNTEYYAAVNERGVEFAWVSFPSSGFHTSTAHRLQDES